MNDSIADQIHRLPLFLEAFQLGRDTGLVIALNMITTAGVDQEQRAARTSPPTPANAHTATVLRGVADQVAVYFRQATR